jgi:hypothetical protein|tara:strand:+ start:1433 stop:1612 length:180 start_codon:yes stop_codon:yes gene_type:complete
VDINLKNKMIDLTISQHSENDTYEIIINEMADKGYKELITFKLNRLPHITNLLNIQKKQ